MLIFAVMMHVSQSMPIQEGRCPLPEDVQVDPSFLESFTMESMLGEWVAYFDETEPTTEIQCMSSLFFEHQIEDKLRPEMRLLQMKNANALKESFRKELEEQGDPEAKQKYFINDGYLLLFPDEQVPTASLHPTDRQIDINKVMLANEKRSKQQKANNGASSAQSSLPSEDEESQEFRRYLKIIDGQIPNSIGRVAEKSNWITIYTCFEIVDYREEVSNRTVSIQELQMKSQSSEKEYIEYREMMRKDWAEEQGKKYDESLFKKTNESAKPAYKQSIELNDKGKEDKETDTSPSSKDGNKIDNEVKSDTTENEKEEKPYSVWPSNTKLKPEETESIQKLEDMLLRNLEKKEEPNDIQLLIEFDEISALEHILDFKMNQQQWKEFRRKEHKEFHAEKEQEEDELDVDKLTYVFEGITVEYVHKAKFSVLVRPIMKDDPQYPAMIMRKVPCKRFDQMKQEYEQTHLGNDEQKVEYFRTKYGVVAGKGFYDEGSEACDYWPYENEAYFDKDQLTQAKKGSSEESDQKQPGYNFVSGESGIHSDLPMPETDLENDKQLEEEPPEHYEL